MDKKEHEIIFHEASQGSEEWLKARIGMLTGTDADVLWVKGKNDGWGVGAVTLARKLVAETLTGQSQDLTLKWSEGLGEFYYDSFEKGVTKWGQVHEEKSRELIYEQKGIMFEKVGFVSIENTIIGVSPDGFSVDGGIRRVLELKHPNTQKVISYFDDIGIFFDEHQYQCIHEAYVLKADEVWLAARDPRLPDPLDNKIALAIIEGEKLKKLVEMYAEKLEKFIEYVDKLKNKIISLA